MILEAGGLLLLVLTGVLLLYPLVRAALRQRRMHRWPQVTGFVLAHQVRIQLTTPRPTGVNANCR